MMSAEAQFASPEHEAMWLRLVTAALSSGSFDANIAVVAADTISAEWLKRKPANGKADTRTEPTELPPCPQMTTPADPATFSAGNYYAPAAMPRGAGIENLPETPPGYVRTRDGLKKC